MEEIEAAVREIVNNRFPNSTVDLWESVPGLKVGGSLTSEEFLGMEQIDRQGQLWQALKQYLTPQDLRRLGTILTFSPQEVAVMEEELAA